MGVLGRGSEFEWAIQVLSEITHTAFAGEPLGSDQVLPHIADEVVATSRLLSTALEIAPEVVIGPVSRERQYWIGTGRRLPVAPATPPTLGREHFVPAGPDTSVSTKPFFVGLFTSTGFGDTYGMWHLYLEATQSSLFPPPWYVWRVQARTDARVLEISSANAWAEFVLAYPLRRDGLFYPDWNAAAADYDGVHVTLRAIIAMQGLSLWTDLGPLAPTFWDVESTLWLRWVFASMRLVETRHR